MQKSDTTSFEVYSFKTRAIRFSHTEGVAHTISKKGVHVKGFTRSKGEGVQTVSDPPFCHFVAPPPAVSVINDRSLRTSKWTL